MIPNSLRAVIDYLRSNKGTLLPYFITGGSAFLVDYLVFWILFSFSGLLFAANMVGLLSGFVISFLGNKYVSFGQKYASDSEPAQQKYSTILQLVSYGVLLIVNTLLSYALIFMAVVAGGDAYGGKVLAMIAIVIWNYFVYKKIIFSRA